MITLILVTLVGCGEVETIETEAETYAPAAEVDEAPAVTAYTHEAVVVVGDRWQVKHCQTWDGIEYCSDVTADYWTADGQLCLAYVSPCVVSPAPSVTVLVVH